MLGDNRTLIAAIVLIPAMVALMVLAIEGSVPALVTISSIAAAVISHIFTKRQK